LGSFRSYQRLFRIEVSNNAEISAGLGDNPSGNTNGIYLLILHVAGGVPVVGRQEEQRVGGDFWTEWLFDGMFGATVLAVEVMFVNDK
jgi:hypothetical protein